MRSSLPASLLAGFLAGLFGAGFSPDGALAAEPPGAPKAGERLVEVRLALSPAAAEALGEPRLRRLVEIELDEAGLLAQGSSGPLGDHVAYAWVDLDEAGHAVVEVRVADRPVYRRRVATARLDADVAARLVAITATELVRAGRSPLRPRRFPAPRRPSPEELEAASRRAPALQVGGAGAAAWVSSGAFLAGPEVGVGFRLAGTSQAVFARWLGGAAGSEPLRAAELGLGVEHRAWLGRGFRLVVGGSASALALRLAEARAVAGEPGEREAFGARAGAVLGAEAALGEAGWLTLGFEPAAWLRDVAYVDGASTARELGGVSLGLRLGLVAERRLSSRAGK